MYKRQPLDSQNANFDFEIDLDGEVYTFDFHFNERSSAWYFSVIKLSTGEGASSIPVNALSLLLSSFVSGSMPPGILFSVDEGGYNIPPGRNDLGTRVKIYYDDNT